MGNKSEDKVELKKGLQELIDSQDQYPEFVINPLSPDEIEELNNMPYDRYALNYHHIAITNRQCRAGECCANREKTALADACFVDDGSGIKRGLREFIGMQDQFEEFQKQPLTDDEIEILKELPFNPDWDKFFLVASLLRQRKREEKGNPCP